MKRAAFALAAFVALAALAVEGCSPPPSDERVDSVEQDATPIDRMLLGQAARYPADRSLRAKLPVFETSMAARRQAAWAIAARVLAPVAIAAHPGGRKATLPRFQTWYSRDDVLPMFDRLFRALPATQQASHARFAASDIAAVFPWNATMAPSLASFTEERLRARRRELATPLGLHSLGKGSRVLMSPAYVGHLLRSYPEIVSCDVPPPEREPLTPTNFAPCLDGEFPADAAAVKLRWVPGGAPMPAYDTSSESLASKLGANDFGAGDAQIDPNDEAIYTMQLTPDTSMRLTAVHIMTKELRDWAWVTLWWSSDPDTDFGADRPASITALGGPWANYKMCVVSGYEEPDHSASWCSNPYLEVGLGAAKTSCIGCHQHGGTAETTATILASPARFPDGARTKVRKNFPADYTFTTTAGLDLAAEMRARIEGLAAP